MQKVREQPLKRKVEMKISIEWERRRRMKKMLMRPKRTNEEHENPGKHKEITRKAESLSELTANKKKMKAFSFGVREWKSGHKRRKIDEIMAKTRKKWTKKNI